MNHTMKSWESITEQGLRRKTKTSINQFGVMSGRSTVDATFSLRQLLGKYREDRKNLYMVFIELEKANDKVPRDLIWRVLEKISVLRSYIDIMKDVHERAIRV